MSKIKTSRERFDAVIAFHGHACPGLAIGVRAAEVALAESGDRAADEELVCVTETDMCAVDAVQALTGCTFGKGNLIHRDHGKIAFSFWRRSDGRGLRLLYRPAADDDPQRAALRRKRAALGLDAAERERWQQLRDEHIQAILDAAPEEIFAIQPLDTPPPTRARALDSLICERCGEPTMESRTRNFLGQILCQPCFDAVEPR